MVIRHDISQDGSGAATYRLTKLCPPPEFVKTAQRETLVGGEALPGHLYADQARRLYPIHTPAATWMSALFFYGGSEKQAAGTETRLLQAADYFAIRPDIQQLQEKLATQNSPAETPTEHYALTWTVQGRQERHYPLRNSGEVKTAAAWLLANRDEFQFPDRQQMARRVLQRAEKLATHVEGENMLRQMTGDGCCPAQKIAEIMTQRSQILAACHPQAASRLDRIATQVKEARAEARAPAFRQQLAEALDQLDRRFGLVGYYGQGLDRPEEALFAVTEKTAQDFITQHVELTTGRIYEKAALSDIALHHVRQWLGDEVADEVSAGGLLLDGEKLATLASSLPRPEARCFERMAAAAGVQPLELTAA